VAETIVVVPQTCCVRCSDEVYVVPCSALTKEPRFDLHVPNGTEVSTYPTMGSDGIEETEAVVLRSSHNDSLQCQRYLHDINPMMRKRDPTVPRVCAMVCEDGGHYTARCDAMAKWHAR
jgi:hypothetical protein